MRKNLNIFQLLGWSAAGMLVLGNLYTPFKWFRKLTGPIKDKTLLLGLSIVQKALLDLHCYGNLGATILSVAHTLLWSSRSPHNDRLVWISLALMAWLSISGLIMRTKLFPSSSRNVSRLLHAQYVLSIILAVTLGAHILTRGEFD